MNPEMPLLTVIGLTKQFGGLLAVHNLGLEIWEGEILGLIGPNGAGKTTVFNLISGFLTPTRGKVIFRGQDITGFKPHRIAGLGIVRTFQLPNLIKEYSVLSNIILGNHLHRSRGKGEEVKKAERIIELFNLGPIKNELAKNLPYGYQRVLALAIALAAEPQLLLLDEPLTGMNPEECTTILKLLQKIRKDVSAILLVEHNMRAVMQTCSRIVVLSFGEKIAQGSADEIRNNQAVIESYLGA